jgi:hypothetical protein
MALTYFAADGSYGDAHGIIILDTRAWSEDDWTRIEYATNDNRSSVAITIAQESGEI